MRKGDRVTGFIALGFSLWLLIESSRFDYLTTYTPGPGFLPFWLGICLGLLSLYLIFDTFKRKADKEENETRLPGKKALFRVGLILLFIAGFAFSLKTFGLPLTTFIFVTLVLFLLEKFGILKSLFYGVVFSASLFLVFRYWLEVDLPKGLLGL